MTIRTFRDLPGPSAADRNSEIGSPSAADSVAIASLSIPATGRAPPTGITVPCFAVASLPGAEKAQKLLESIVAEFLPIIQRRNYHVHSVSEFCCCGLDGLDDQGNNRKRSRRKEKPNGLWGYNQQSVFSPRGVKHCTIHIRLRHPLQHHTHFLTYNDIAGTLAHEIAHCQVGPHNEQFYKVMDEIIDEHASLNAGRFGNSGPVWHVSGGGGRVLANAGADSSATFVGAGRKLGTSGAVGHENGRHRLANAAQRRLQQPSTGYTLGGDAQFVQWMTPVEAAVVAAEARRRAHLLRQRGDLRCGANNPCFVEIDSSDTRHDRAPRRKLQDDVVVDENLDCANKRPPATKAAAKAHSLEPPAVIDLTADDESNGDYNTFNEGWACQCCTFWNPPSESRMCSMCCSPQGDNYASVDAVDGSSREVQTTSQKSTSFLRLKLYK
jgi:DNA-dependent metalloprotease WSS1